MRLAATPTVYSLAALLLFLHGQPVATARSAGAKELNFPSDRSYGKVTVFRHPWVKRELVFRAKAQGTIVLPADGFARYEPDYVTGLDLASLTQLKKENLWSLKLNRLPLKNEQLHLAQFKNLEELDVNNTDLSDEGIREISALTKLQRLDLQSTLITANAVGYFCRIKTLTTVNLESNDLGDKCVDSLSKMVWVKELNLGRTGVTAGGLRKLHKLKNLAYLDLSNNPGTIGDSAVRVMTQFPKLISLKLCRDDITRGAIPDLKKLTTLKALYFNFHNFTQRDLLGLKTALPACRLRDCDVSRVPIEVFGPLH